MRGVNRATIIGNLGNDPETRYTQSGSAVTTISVATSERWKDKDTGEQREQTEWHRIVFFNRLAEIAGEYLKKGSQVYIEGQIKTRKWQDQSGQDRYTTEIVARDLQMLSGRGDGSAQRPANGGGFRDRSAQPARQAQPSAAQQQVADEAQPRQEDAFHDDDIPF